MREVLSIIGCPDKFETIRREAYSTVSMPEPPLDAPADELSPEEGLEEIRAAARRPRRW